MRATAHFQFMLKTAIQQRLFVVLCLVVSPLTMVQGQGATPPAPTLTSIVTDFVQQMVARAGLPRSASISFQNISVLPPDLQESVQNAIFTALRNAGIRTDNT